MIPVFLASLVIVQCVAAEVKPVGAELLRIDLELTLENYKQLRAEQMKLELQLKMRQVEDEKGDEEVRTRELRRMESRFDILQVLTDQLRRKAVALENELAEGERAETKRKTSKGEHAPVNGGAEAHGAEGDLRKRMLGTWRLVSFADGRVSNANVGELKFIGEGHFAVSRLDPRTGKLDYHMGGTYTLDGDEYVETVEYGTSGPIGETFTYKLSVEGDKFTQMGRGNPWSLVFERAK